MATNLEQLVKTVFNSLIDNTHTGQTWCSCNDFYGPISAKYIFDEEDWFGSKNYNFQEEKDKYVITMDLPGIGKNNINISCEEKEKEATLVIKWKTKEGKEKSKSFVIPKIKIDRSGISAKYEDGILVINAEKKLEVNNSLSISIQ